MLSFLRESQVGQAPDCKSCSSDGDTQQQQYITVAGKGKNARKATYLLTTLFAAGAVCLWLMIQSSAPATVSAGTAADEEIEIEQAISRLTGVGSEMFSRMDEIVQKFYEFSNIEQVTVDELVRNPFIHELFLGGIGQAIDLAGSATERQGRQTNQMELLSIMQDGQRFCCMIEDKILYEGDSIKGYKVREIGGNFVRLESESLGTTVTLRLAE